MLRNEMREKLYVKISIIKKYIHNFKSKATEEKYLNSMVVVVISFLIFLYCKIRPSEL